MAEFYYDLPQDHEHNSYGYTKDEEFVLMYEAWTPPHEVTEFTEEYNRLIAKGVRP